MVVAAHLLVLGDGESQLGGAFDLFALADKAWLIGRANRVAEGGDLLVDGSEESLGVRVSCRARHDERSGSACEGRVLAD